MTGSYLLPIITAANWQKHYGTTAAQPIRRKNPRSLAVVVLRRRASLRMSGVSCGHVPDARCADAVRIVELLPLCSLRARLDDRQRRFRKITPSPELPPPLKRQDD